VELQPDFEEWITRAAVVYGVHKQQVEDGAAAVLNRAPRKGFSRFSTKNNQKTLKDPPAG
jgi:hypothetical protein